MSIEDNVQDGPNCQRGDDAVISVIIPPKDRNLGGFSVRRFLPSDKIKKVGPWVFFDHMGPTKFKTNEGIDVRPHPHINLATVTYLFGGEILHRDSLGSKQLISPGAVNLMVAGRGIVHSERETPEARSVNRTVEGLQLWLALPEGDEDMAPEFWHYAKDAIPRKQDCDVVYRLLIGEAFGMKSPVKSFARTLYLEANMAAGSSFNIPLEDEMAIYVVKGEVRIEATRLPEHHMAVFKPKATPKIKSLEHSIIVLIGGEGISKRYIEWNFVSSRQQRIEQAKQDWQNGKFKSIDGDEQEFIPLP